MGKKEHPFVWYYNKNLHFAELINGWLFHGRDRLAAGDISGSDRRMLTRKKQNLYRDRYRDLCKNVNGTVFRLLIGVEQQEHVHYAMPVRIMDYDSSSYCLQKDKINSRHTGAQDLKEDEFLSGFSREDRLLPVISLVLYCGSRPWDGALRLHELLEFGRMPPELKEYVADYPIHVLDICHTSDERLAEFPPDIRTMFFFMKYKDDPDSLTQKLTDAEMIRRDTCEAIADITGEQRFKKFLPQKKGEKICMCKAIDMLIKDGEKRGEKRGYELGVAQERENTERERKNAKSQKIRAEKAEARIRELERMMNI